MAHLINTEISYSGVEFQALCGKRMETIPGGTYYGLNLKCSEGDGK